MGKSRRFLGLAGGVAGLALLAAPLTGCGSLGTQAATAAQEKDGGPPPGAGAPPQTETQTDVPSKDPGSPPPGAGAQSQTPTDIPSKEMGGGPGGPPAATVTGRRGEAVTVTDYRVTVGNVQELTSATLSAPAKPETRLVGVDVVLENATDRVLDPTALTFLVQDDQGIVYAALPAGLEQGLPRGSLAGAARAQGWLGFEINTGRTPQALLISQDGGATTIASIDLRQ